MGRRPNIQYPGAASRRFMDLGPGMSKQEVEEAAGQAQRQKRLRANARLSPPDVEPPWEVYRVFPGNKALDVLALLFKYRPETQSELEALGAHLWAQGAVADCLPIQSDADGDKPAFRDAIEEADAYALYMQGLHFLWRRAFGAQHAPRGATTTRGLDLRSFLTLLSYGCADVLLEPRQRYGGERGWVAVAVVHDLEAHWECAVRDHEGMFRRAIPADDMHTARLEYGAICYELLDDHGDIAMWEALGDAFADLQPQLGRDRHGHMERLHDIRVHVMAQPVVYVEMVNPKRRYELCATRWLRVVEGDLVRPLRHRLFLSEAPGHIGEEVGFYVETGNAADTDDYIILTGRVEANMPGGLECYGVLPQGVPRYKAPLNGRIRAGRQGGRTQADSIALEQDSHYSEI